MSTAQRTQGRRAGAPTVGDLLRHWRQEARRSQLDLASASGVSARHLSFVETGRARPSRALLLHLAEHLEMPLRERNALVLAAGYAPAYAESDLGADHLRSAREALTHLLSGHEPYPALVLDRWGDVLMANRPTALLLAGTDPALLTAPNAYRIGLHPDGLLRRMREPAPWIAHIGQRLIRALRWSGDPRLAELLAEVRSYPGVADVLAARPDPGPQELLLTVTLADPAGDLALYTTVTTFGGPHDVTLAELAVESFFPADAATRARLHAAASALASDP
ncbi:MAG TPA: helix-turn-helix transcriptional regulator [Pseudonocardia sp.]